MHELTGLSWPTLGATGLLALTVLLVLTGRLLPLWLYRQVREDAKAERERARQAEDTNERLARSLEQATNVARVTRNLMESLPRNDEDETR